MGFRHRLRRRGSQRLPRPGRDQRSQDRVADPVDQVVTVVVVGEHDAGNIPRRQQHHHVDDACPIAGVIHDRRPVEGATEHPTDAMRAVLPHADHRTMQLVDWRVAEDLSPIGQAVLEANMAKRATSCALADSSPVPGADVT